ncbi:MAG TPA: YciI family protein [Ignavibacteria bacterium]|nr:YciI family protein [Ignavibacteria bacterium]
MENKISTKQRFCYILRLYPEYFELDGWTDEAGEIVGRHFNYLKKLSEDGILILAGRTLNEPMTEEDFGIAILETDSKEEAQNIMDNDPAVVGRVMYAKFYDFSLALMRK